MKCQILFSRKNKKKNITNLLSAESAHSMVGGNIFPVIEMAKKTKQCMALKYKDDQQLIKLPCWFLR